MTFGNIGKGESDRFGIQAADVSDIKPPDPSEMFMVVSCKTREKTDLRYKRKGEIWAHLVAFARLFAKCHGRTNGRPKKFMGPLIRD